MAWTWTTKSSISANWSGQLTTTYDWDTILIGFSGGTDPHGGITLWHSGEALHLWHPNQSSPATEWEAEIDELYVKASQELDRETRVGYYHRAQEIIAENVPVIYTTQSERISAVRNVFGTRDGHAVRPVGHALPVPHGRIGRGFPRTNGRAVGGFCSTGAAPGARPPAGRTRPAPST